MLTDMRLVHTDEMDLAVAVSAATDRERDVRQNHQQLADIILTMC